MHICPCFAKKGSMSILPVFFVWVGFSLCNFSVYRNVIIHWFRILIYFFSLLLVNHTHTLHCYGNWGSCKARIWWRAASHLSSLRAWSKPIVCNTVWIKLKVSAFTGSVKRASSLLTSVLLPSVQADGIGSRRPFAEHRPNTLWSQ